MTLLLLSSQCSNYCDVQNSVFFWGGGNTSDFNHFDVMWYKTSNCSGTFFLEWQVTSIVRNQLWLVDPGIKMFRGGQTKGQNQGESILLLIHEVCFTVLLEVVITSASKVKKIAESMQRKYMDGAYILIGSQTFLLQT